MQLFKSIRVLASNPDDQFEYLTDLGTYPSTDELALEFTYAFDTFRNDDQHTRFNSNELLMDKIDCIDQIFDSMSDGRHQFFWNVSALTGKEWNEVRHIAKEVQEIITILMKDGSTAPPFSSPSNEKED